MGDFGLAEDVYASGYFRQNDRANVKLPFKWMALESLNDAIFTEKTDVVSQCCMVYRHIYCLKITCYTLNYAPCLYVCNGCGLGTSRGRSRDPNRRSKQSICLV